MRPRAREPGPGPATVEPQCAPAPSASPAPPSLATVAMLQRTAGNRAVTMLLRQPAQAAPPAAATPGIPLLAKLVAGGDRHELLAEARTMLETGADHVDLPPARMPIGSDAERKQALADIRHAAIERAGEHLRNGRKARETEEQILTRTRPWVQMLKRAKDPEWFEHTNQRAVDDMREVLQLEAVGGAVAESAAAHAGDAKAQEAATKAVRERAEKAGGLNAGDAWCGSFAFMMHQKAGIPAEMKVTTQGVEGYVNLFSYAAKLYVFAEDKWWTLQAYHNHRNSPRQINYIREPGATGEVDLTGVEIRAGDIVLLDNARGVRGDHVQMVRSYDATTGELTTVAGNEPSVNISGARNLGRNPSTNKSPDADRMNELKQKDKSRTPAEEKEFQELWAKVKEWDKANKHTRVWAVGHYSVVDYEHFAYTGTHPPKGLNVEGEKPKGP